MLFALHITIVCNQKQRNSHVFYFSLIKNHFVLSQSIVHESSSIKCLFILIKEHIILSSNRGITCTSLFVLRRLCRCLSFRVTIFKFFLLGNKISNRKRSNAFRKSYQVERSTWKDAYVVANFCNSRPQTFLCRMWFLYVGGLCMDSCIDM